METTRRYPRTALDAFRGPDYACAVERPLDKPDRIVAWGCAAVALVLVVFVAVGWV